jgi:hypothetical protein
MVVSFVILVYAVSCLILVDEHGLSMMAYKEQNADAVLLGMCLLCRELLVHHLAYFHWPFDLR